MPVVSLRVHRNPWLIACRLLLAFGAVASAAAIGWGLCLCLCLCLACSYRWRATRVCADSGQSAVGLACGAVHLSELSDRRAAQLGLELLESCEDFDEVLAAFEPVQAGTRCPFARAARLWHGAAWNRRLGLAENAAANAWRLAAFCAACRRLDLDGFVLQLPSPHCDTFGAFSVGVMETLRTLAKCDVADCMADVENLDRLGWVFQFAGVTFFVTTFAPFYSPEDSRFAYGADCGFVLLQPEISFARRGLPPDTPHTKWDHRQPGRTVRDVARSAFADAGQSYLIRQSVAYPMIRDIVQVPKQLLPQPTEELPPHLSWWLVALKQQRL